MINIDEKILVHNVLRKAEALISTREPQPAVATFYLRIAT
jgi:hypothetical protein